MDMGHVIEQKKAPVVLLIQRMRLRMQVNISGYRTHALKAMNKLSHTQNASSVELETNYERLDVWHSDKIVKEVTGEESSFMPGIRSYGGQYLPLTWLRRGFYMNNY